MTDNKDQSNDWKAPSDNDIAQIESESEYTVTEGGFHRLELELDNDTITKLVDYWATHNLEPASIEQYREMMQTTTQAEALYGAIINDQVIAGLRAMLDKSKSDNKEPNV
jgi:hypothetical protein